MAAVPPSEKDVRAKGQNPPVGGWEMPERSFTSLVSFAAVCPRPLFLGKRNGDEYTAQWERRARVWTHPGERALEVQMLDSVGIRRQCSLMTNTQALDRVRASPADGQLLTLCIKQVASLL